MPIIEQIEDAIQVHCAWADRLKAAIEAGASDLAPDAVGRDESCPFGRWLLGDGIPESAKRLHSYDHALEVHRDFHRHAGEALALALAGERDEAVRRLDNTSPFTMASVMLTLTLRAWQIDLAEAA
ncbi:MAG: CZB domain-containing protein [Rhodospirillaceae bacterium]